MRNSRKIIFAENFKMVMAFYSTQLFLLEENVAKGTFGSIHSSAEADGPLPARPSAAGPRAQGLRLQAWGGVGRGLPRAGWGSPQGFSQACGKGPCRLHPKELQHPQNWGQTVFEGMSGTGSHGP